MQVYTATGSTYTGANTYLEKKDITFLEEYNFASSGGLVADVEEAYLSDSGTGTAVSSSGGAAIDNEAFPKGVTIYGRWTKFTLAEGLVIAYRG